jgi:hypothetical protein
VDAWAAKLREYIELRRQGEATMTSAIKARQNVEAMRTRREGLEADLAKVSEVVKATEASSAGRILEGANIDKEAQLITDQRLKRQKLTEAIVLSREREQKAADALYYKELEQAWTDASKLWRSSFAKLDKLSATVGKLAAEHEELTATRNKLSQMGGKFAKTEGGSLFGPEVRIIGQASEALQLLDSHWKALEAARARYEAAYTGERKTGTPEVRPSKPSTPDLPVRQDDVWLSEEDLWPRRQY